MLQRLVVRLYTFDATHGSDSYVILGMSPHHHHHRQRQTIWMRELRTVPVVLRTSPAPSTARPCILQEVVGIALESFFRVGATAGGKTNDRFDALMQARLLP